MLVGLAVLVGGVMAVTATPLQQAGDPSMLQDAFHDLVQIVKEQANSGKSVQEQMLATLRDIASTQEGLQPFLLGGAQVTLGNNTQLGDILAEVKSLNDNFKKYLKSLVCPEPFINLGEECFNFQLEDLSWEESRKRCLKMGSDLAVPENLTQVRLFIGQNFPRKNHRNFWLGGIKDNDVWEWLSGGAVNPDLWYTNEPSGSGDCLAMFDGWEQPLTDFPCENQRRAICERALTN